MSQPRIFVSNSHQDNAYCREFVTAMRQKLASDDAVWYDEHNLGWGKIRREIERELAQRQHFIAILSPTAVESDWVNDEIDAAIELRRRGSLQTIQFVIAVQCDMPLLLSNYKRVVKPDGQPYVGREAASRALAVIQPISPNITSVTPQSTTSQAQQPSSSPAPAPPFQLSPMELNEQMFQQRAELKHKLGEDGSLSEAPVGRQPTTPQKAPIAPEHFPQRLASLGFVGRTTVVDGKPVEYILPPLCTVPAGPFLMGSDPTRDPDARHNTYEQPQHTLTLPTYEIARFPVTVAEYACFVRAGHAEPEDWQSQLGKLDHPVVYVNWHDAVAYAYWLSVRTSQSWWRLSTEAEWEKAARGTDGRIYPWGDTFDNARCNTYESVIKATTPVGSFPTGSSLYGAQDMAGNVLEWTSSLFRQYPYNIADGREDANPIEKRVVRGGTWAAASVFARAAFRGASPPGDFNVVNGFRLVRAAPNS